MTLSSIFKRRSRKSLKGHERTTSGPPAPLPFAESAVTFPSPDSGFETVHTSPASAALSDSVVPPTSLCSHLDSSPPSMPSVVVFPVPEVSSQAPQSTGNGLLSNVSHPNSATKSSVSVDYVSIGDDNGVMGTLTVVSAEINKKQSDSKIERALNAIDDKVTTVQGQQTLVNTFTAPIKAVIALDAVSGVKQTIEEGINSFLDGVPVLMKALDEVAKIHPFVGVAVLAFKAVYTLETKRRANDKKIVALYVEMKDMIAVLIQLKNVKDDEDVGPDGITIKGRLQDLVKTTADDMKDCANTCDAYSKMRLLAKVLKGPLWEGTLADFAGTFTKRRTEFEFALSIHVGRGVDEANRKLDNLAHELKERTDVLLKFMQTYVPPEQKDLVALVNQKGGAKAVMENDTLLKELNGRDSKRPVKSGDVRSQISATHSRAGKDELEELKSNLREDPAAAIVNNLQTFERKFAMQQRQIVEEVDRVVTRESDRVIQTVTSGPHDKVVDRDMYNVWKEMGWRGSVKARHFVLALRDYYCEKADDKRRKEFAFESVPAIDPDTWALEHLTLQQLQPIVDAFDEDASGFITVAEANKLIAARPLDWSLPHWIAYWSVGWQIVATQYVDKILSLLGKMFALKDTLHPANVPYVDQYLETVWLRIAKLTLAIRPFDLDNDLPARFQSYMDAEEERIRKNLEAIRYDIDDSETVPLITGPGRIERYIFPLLYLLLKRDFDIIRVCQTKVVNRDELWDCADSIDYVLEAVQGRYVELEAIFKQQNLDLARQFKTICAELYDYWHDPTTFFSRSNLRTIFFKPYTLNENEMCDTPPEDILNYPLDEDYPFDCAAYDVFEDIETEEDRTIEGPFKALIGQWHVMLADADEYPCHCMFTIRFHASAEGQKIEGSGKSPEGTTYTVTTTYEATEHGECLYHLTQKYATRFTTKCYLGSVNEEGTLISGFWGYRSADGSADPFIMSRVAPDILRHRPSPQEFMQNKAQVLWKFALSAVEDQVRRQMWSWSHFKKRRDVRKRYIELLLRKWDYGHLLDPDEQEELIRCRKTLTPADARFYETLYDYQLRTTPIHIGIACDCCNGIIGGTRTICIDCDKDKTVNLCDDPRCSNAQISREDLNSPHLPSHSVYKVRKMVHLREFGTVDKNAQQCLITARTAFTDAAEVEETQLDGTAGEGDATAPVIKECLQCIVCKKPVSQPCWYCMDCPHQTFICLDCDPKDGVDIDGHSKDHPLVKCQQEAVLDAPLTVEQRLETMEQRLETMDSRFNDMDGKIVRVDDRLLRIEKLLETMSQSMGTAPPPSAAPAYVEKAL